MAPMAQILLQTNLARNKNALFLSSYLSLEMYKHHSRTERADQNHKILILQSILEIIKSFRIQSKFLPQVIKTEAEETMNDVNMSRKLAVFILISSLLVILPISASSYPISCDDSLDNFNVEVGNSAAYISVPFHYQSKNYYCGPAALEMVFDYYGKDIPQTEIADVARTIRSTTFSDELRRATHFSNLSTSLGDEMPGNITGYPTRKVGYAAFEHWGLTIDDLKTLINNGEPVIVLMWYDHKDGMTHYRVVVGYNETHMIMNDPWNKDIWGGTYGGANTSMTCDIFLALWEYSSNWGLWVHPWVIELQMPSIVGSGDDFEVIANITYRCSAPFDISDYPAASCEATIELQEGLELAFGETTEYSLGSITTGNSVQTSWSIHAVETGFYNISVTVTGIVEGGVGAHATLPSYNYEDKIGGSCTNSLSIVNQTYRVHNLDTGLNYTTIQEAIDDNETLDGHTIFVEEGIYNEHVIIGKPMFLLGQSRNTTIIDGDGKGMVLQILTDDVKVLNFTIRNAGKIWGPPPGTGHPNSCVFGNGANIRIENNTVTDAAVCIWFSPSFNVSVSDNIVLNGVYGGVIGYNLSNSALCRNHVDRCGLMGLHLDGNSAHCKIVNNTVTNCLEGIELESSAGNLVEGNRLVSNNVSVMLNQCGSLNVFRRNNMTSYWYNIIVWGWSLEAFMQDIDDSNIVNNKTVYYLATLHDVVIDPSDYPNLGYLTVVNCTNVTVRDFNVTHNGDGVLLAYSANCTFANITLSGNHGPLLHGGLTFFESNNNLAVNNRISNNSVGVCFYQSDGNVFYHNSFVYNERQVISNFYSPLSEPVSPYSINKWDNDFEGNCWSNYTGADLRTGSYHNETGSDGIGDTPHVIDENNQDTYPLMGPFSDFNVTSEHYVQTICNSTISNFQFNGTAMSFNITGDDGTVGFCRICIPTALMNDAYNVFVNGTEIPHTLLWCSNSTHSYLYFTYNHSTQEVVIIPEFPLLIILPLFMMATLLIVIVYRRKNFM